MKSRHTKKLDALFWRSFRRMFRAVGYKNPTVGQIKQIANDDPFWYSRQSWTHKQEMAFMDACRKDWRKTFPRMTKHEIESEIVWFCMTWGWKTKQEGE